MYECNDQTNGKNRNKKKKKKKKKERKKEGLDNRRQRNKNDVLKLLIKDWTTVFREAKMMF